MKQSFAYLVFQKESDTQPLSGAMDKETAERVATALGGVVRENVLFRFTGSAWCSRSGFIFDGKELGSAVLDELGISTKSATHDLGMIEITIKQIPEGEPEDL